MAKFFSVGKIIPRLKLLFLRFPAGLFVTLVGTVSCMILADRDILYTDIHNICTKLLQVAVFVFPWTVLSELLTEKYKLGRPVRLIVQVVVTLLLSTYYFFLPADAFDLQPVESTRLMILSGVGFILLFFAPFDSSNSERLWRYAASLVRGAIIALLFAVPLGIGLTLSVSAVWYLFQLNTGIGQMMSYIWSLVLGIFATWIFLSNIPNPHEEPLYERLSKVLQLFVYYIWFPLVGVFFTILYVYCGRIVITSIWPEGGVVYWIIGFSAAGLLLYLTSYGEQEKRERFKKIFFKTFFVLLIPLVFILFWSIMLRVQEYGITEGRYLVVLAGIFLTLTSLYCLVRTTYTLRFMAWLAAILLFFSVVGPWNMFSVSLSNQITILEKLLIKNNILVDGKIEKPTVRRSLPSEDYTSIKSTMEYIIRHNGLVYIQPWFSQNLEEIFRPAQEGRYRISNIYKVTEILAIDSGPIYRTSNSFNFYTTRDYSTVFTYVQGYDFVIEGNRIFSSQGNSTINTELGNFSFELSKAGSLKIIKDKQLLAEKDLLPLVSSLISKYGVSETVSSPDMTESFENDKAKIKLLFSSISGKKEEGDKFNITDVTFTLLGALKK